jgi:hypothetical protein
MGLGVPEIGALLIVLALVVYVVRWLVSLFSGR